MIQWKAVSASAKKGVLCTVFIAALSYCTYVYNYSYPQGLFWDENFHIPSAQKYLNGIFFMQSHPPLGKMLIALGEKITDANAVDNEMVHTIHSTKVSPGFSFVGYRLIPVLLAWLTAPFLLWILFLLTRSWLIATALSFLYVFDNALIIQGRGAMLDAPMLFFCTATILMFLLMLEHKRNLKALYCLSIWFGIFFACAFTTKLLGLIVLLLFPAALLAIRPPWKHMLLLSLTAFASFGAVFVTVWQVHFMLLPMPDLNARYTHYTLNEENLARLQQGEGALLRTLPNRLKEYVAFQRSVSDSVPRLDLCKNPEYGSPFFLWPLGARTIKYRWEPVGPETWSYLYLVPNPVGWLAGLVGVIFAGSILLASFFFPPREKLQNRYLLLVFMGLYLSYMYVLSRIDRVMYLYHYLLPLVFSFLLFSLVFMEIKQVGRWKITTKQKETVALIFACLLVVSHQFYRPLTYYLPLSHDQFERRNLLRIWNMYCVGCDHYDSLVVPTKTRTR